MTIREMLQNKKRRVVTIDGCASVSQAVAEMLVARIGCILVLIDGVVEGIFTERDALRLWGSKENIRDEAVLKYMTQNLIIVSPEDSIEQAMSVMTQQNIRHLLVVDGQTLMSVLSIRDLVRAFVGSLQASIRSIDKVSI